MRRRFAALRLLRSVLLLVPMAAVCVAGIGAAPQSVTEASLKSAFLYKFTLFANWNDGLGEAAVALVADEDVVRGTFRVQQRCIVMHRDRDRRGHPHGIGIVRGHRGKMQ